MGQRIRTLGELDPESPVKAIKEVSSAREEIGKSKTRSKTTRKAEEKIVNDIKSEIKKATPKIKDWEGFIKSLEC